MPMRTIGWASIWAGRRSRSSRSTPRGASACACGCRHRATTTARRSRRSRRSWRTRSAQLGVVPGASSVGIGTPGSLSRATGLLRGSNSVWLNGQPLARDLEAALARAVRITQRRELLRAVGGDRRRGRGRGRRVRRDPRHGRRRRHRRATAACWTAPTRSPASGATIRCRGRATTSGRAPPASAGASACIETWLSGPGFARDHAQATGSALDAAQIVAAGRRAATPRARRRSRATKSGWRARWRT